MHNLSHMNGFTVQEDMLYWKSGAIAPLAWVGTVTPSSDCVNHMWPSHSLFSIVALFIEVILLGNAVVALIIYNKRVDASCQQVFKIFYIFLLYYWYEISVRYCNLCRYSIRSSTGYFTCNLNPIYATMSWDLE